MTEQLKRERDQAVARLRVANGHTEDAFKKLQTAQHEIDILRASLNKAHAKTEEARRGWLADIVSEQAEIQRVTAERDANKVALKRVQEHLSKTSECLLDATTGRDTVTEERDEARFWAKKLMRESESRCFTNWLSTVKKRG